jgi:hypothetical protein
MSVIKPSLEDLKEVVLDRERRFEAVLFEKYPHTDRISWDRAYFADGLGIADEWNRAMVRDPDIRAAYISYLVALHHFYQYPLVGRSKTSLG